METAIKCEANALAPQTHRDVQGDVLDGGRPATSYAGIPSADLAACLPAARPRTEPAVSPVPPG